MRLEASVTSLSWIPQGAVEGFNRLSFGLGVAHFYPPPPEVLGNLDALEAADRFRMVNRLEGTVVPLKSTVTWATVAVLSRMGAVAVLAGEHQAEQVGDEGGFLLSLNVHPAGHRQQDAPARLLLGRS